MSNSMMVNYDVFVGNITDSATESQILDHFSQAGEITAIKFGDPSKDYPERYCFITYTNQRDVIKAILDFQCTYFQGNLLRVTFKVPPKWITFSCKLFIDNLDPNITPKQLHDYFVKYGFIYRLKILGNGMAVISFYYPASAMRAFYNSKWAQLGKRTIFLTWNKSPKKIRQYLGINPTINGQTNNEEEKEVCPKEEYYDGHKADNYKEKLLESVGDTKKYPNKINNDPNIELNRENDCIIAGFKPKTIQE